MAEIVMCEPWELFNLLNQQRNSVSRLAQSNYLCLFGEESNNRTETHSQPRCSGDAIIFPLSPLSCYRCSRDTQLQNESHYNCAKHQTGGSVQRSQFESRDQRRRQIKSENQNCHGGRSRKVFFSFLLLFICLIFRMQTAHSSYQRLLSWTVCSTWWSMMATQAAWRGEVTQQPSIKGTLLKRDCSSFVLIFCVEENVFAWIRLFKEWGEFIHWFKNITMIHIPFTNANVMYILNFEYSVK